MKRHKMSKSGQYKAKSRRSADIDPLDVLHRLLKLGNQLNAPFSEHLEKRYRVTMNEFRVIMLIGRLGAAASHELADISGVTTMSISRAVTSLQRKGWVICKTDRNNRRRKILRLSKEGARLYKKMLPTADKVAEYVFDALSSSEIRTFDRHLTKLSSHLELEDEEGHSIFIEKTRPKA